jgi:glycosyltransferase involved in cell wall biosynthesis
MNVLIVSAMFPPIRTGTSFYTRNLAMALAERGHKVSIVATVNRVAGAEDDCVDGCNLIRLKALHIPLQNMFKHLRFCSFHPVNYVRVARAAFRPHADVILLVNHYLDIAYPAIFASVVLGIPMVVSVGTQLQSLKPVRDFVLRFLDRLICGRTIFPFARRIVAWDSEIRRYLIQVQGHRIDRKIVVIPYGAHGTPVSFTSIGSRERRDQILGVGAVIEQRNFLFLVRAFHKISGNYPDLRLKIIGHVYYDAARELCLALGIEDRVEFTGELPHAAVLEEHRRTVLFWGLATGKYSGLGVAAVEAMLSGLPVFSDIPENLLGDSRLIDMEHYVHTSSGDLEGTVQRMRQIIDTSELRNRIGSNARKFVSEQMNWDTVAARFETLFRGI